MIGVQGWVEGMEYVWIETNRCRLGICVEEFTVVLLICCLYNDVGRINIA